MVDMETESNTLTVTINANGAAFTEYGEPGPELSRLLRRLADRIEVLGTRDAATFPLIDTNGNTAGTATWTGDTDQDDDEDDDNECEGHESLAGHHMGETVYCDGSCR